MTSMRAPATTATGHAPPSGAATQGVGRAPCTKVTSAACRSAIAGDAWRTADDVCRALGVTSAIERARVSSALSHDAQRGLAEFRIVGWRKNRHVNAYRLRRDALSVAERCRIANEASHGGPMRPVLRDLCILAMQASPDREWSTPGLAETIGRKASGVLPALRQMRTDCLVQSRPVRVRNKYIELRWTLTDEGRAFKAKVQNFPKPDQPTPDRWPGRDHEALQDAWPHPVTIPMGGSARVHTMQGGWA